MELVHRAPTACLQPQFFSINLDIQVEGMIQFQYKDEETCFSRITIRHVIVKVCDCVCTGAGAVVRDAYVIILSPRARQEVAHHQQRLHILF